MAEEEALKRYRERIDEVKGYVKQYGKDAALAHILKLPRDSEDFIIWVLALLEL